MALRVPLEQIGAEIVLLGAKDFAGIVRSTERDIDRLNSSVKKLESESSASFRALQQVSVASLGAIGIALGLASGAIVGLGGAALKSAGDYENAMQIVRGVTLGTTEEIKALDDTITQIASTTKVGMQQAAEAAGELARAGIDIKEQTQGALQAVVDLSIASAGELGLERSAVLVGSALKAFKLEGEDATRVVNAITVAAQNSAITFVDLQRSFQQAAPTASLLGLSVEDLAAALGVLGEQGIRGSDAGTSLKQAFQQLIHPSKQGLAAMKEFGISLFDASGAARPFRDVIVDLEREFGDQAVATGKITEAQRAAALATIGGSDAIRALIVSAQRGTEAFDAFTGAMSDSERSAKAMAAIMQQSLNSQIQIFLNNINILANKIGAGLVPGLKEIVANAILAARSLIPIAELIGNIAAASISGSGFGPILDQINKLASPEVSQVLQSLLSLILTIRDAITDDIAPAFGVLGQAIIGVGQNSTFLETISSDFLNIAGAVRVVSAGIAAVTLTIAGLINSLSQSSTGVEILHTALAAIILLPIATAVAALVLMAPAILAAVGPTLALGAAITAVIAVLINLPGLWQAALNAISQSVEDANVTPVPDLGELSDALGEAEDGFSGLIDSVNEIIDSDQPDVSPNLDELVSALNEAGGSYEEAINSINELAGSVDAALVPDNELVAAALSDEVALHEAAGEAVVSTTDATNNAVNNAIAEATPFDLLASQLRITVIDIQNLLNEIIDGLRILITNITTAAANWINSWHNMSYAVGLAATSIIGSINSINAAIAGVSDIQLPNIGTGAEDLGVQVRNTTAAFDAFKSSIGSVRTQFDLNVNSVMDEARKRIAAAGGAATTTAGAFDDLGNKGAGGAKKAKKGAEDALPAINGFIDALEKAARLQSFKDAFGDTGAEAIDKLIEAIVSNVDKDGGKAAEALHKLIQEVRKANIPEWEQLAEDAQDAFKNALINRTDDNIDAAKQTVAAIAAAMKSQGELSFANFTNAFKLADQAANLGSDGDKLMDSLKESIINGGTKVIAEAAKSAQGLAASFFEKLPIDKAREFASTLMDGIRDVIRNKTPESIEALNQLIQRLNFDTAITKASEARDKAIAESAKKTTEAIAKAQRDAFQSAEKLIQDSNQKSLIDTQIEQIKNANDAVLNEFKRLQDGIALGRKRRREDADAELNNAREDADRLEKLAKDIADARKNSGNRADKAKGPQGGIELTASAGSDDEIKKIRDKFDEETKALDKKRAREVEDLAKRRAQENEDIEFQRTQAVELSDAKKLLDKEVQRIKDDEELRQFHARLIEINQKANDEITEQKRVLEEVKKAENDKFDNEVAKLTAIKELGDSLLDGFLSDLDAAVEKAAAINDAIAGSWAIEIRKLAGATSTAAPVTNPDGSQGQQVSIATGDFAHGGAVQRTGLIRAHSGEYVLNIEQVSMLERLFRPQPINAGSNSSSVTYQVNASYGSMQSEASVRDDMISLVALTS